MKKSGQRWWLQNQHQLNAFNEWVSGQWELGKKPTVQILAADRSVDQNAMFYALYRDISAQQEDKSQLEVKRICKLHYGIGILKGADPEWAEWYDRAIKPMDYEDKLFLVTDLPVTSRFTKEQATEYIDTILSEYGKQGFYLADPRQAA